MIMQRLTVLAAERARSAFTLVELLVSVGVLALFLLMVSQLMNSAATISRTGNKHIDTDTEARAVLDRMAVDFGKMLKRTDVDYYIKQPVNYTGHGNGHAWGKKISTGEQGSDQIAFFSQVSGYSSGSPSPISLVAYRVNSNTSSPAYLRLERMGKGLLWNDGSTTVVTNPNSRSSRDIAYPIIFSPGQIALGTGPWVQPWGPWSAAITNSSSGGANNSSQDSDYEVIGQNVFRFEYYYLLKNGLVTDIPWDRTARPAQTTITAPQSIGLVDVEAIGVTIAVLDPANRSLVPVASLLNLVSDLDDFAAAPGRGVGRQNKFYSA